MERIRLSQSEKITLRTIGGKTFDNDFLKEFSGAVDSLERKGLVKAMWSEVHELMDARLSPQGRFYLDENPKLRNKTDWSKVGAIAAIASFVATVVGWLVACNKIL